MPSPLIDLPDNPAQFTEFLRQKLRTAAPIHSADELADRAVTRSAAVLVGFIWRDSGAQILLTQRAQHLPAHPGQISFPGGAREADDASHIATALRESWEEIGLQPDCVEVLGQLGDYHTVSRYRVTPIVGVVSPHARFIPHPTEVESVFELPAKVLLNPACYERRWVRRAGVRAKSYFVQYQDRLVWGATAGMLLSMARMLGAAGNPVERDDLEHFP